MQYPKISVVIPSWNRHDILSICLEHLKSQTTPLSEFEVIVVDDGSEPPLNINDCAGNVKLIRCPHRGEPSSRNRGIVESRAPIILCLDNDVLLKPGALSQHISMHIDNPQLDAIQGFVTWDPRLEISLFMRWLEDGGPQFSFHEIQLYGPAYYNFYDCHLSLKRSVFDRIGLFDEELANGAFDDLEFGYRFFQAGLNYLFHSEFVGLHHRPVTSIREYCDSRMIMLGRSYPNYARKVPDEAAKLRELIHELERQGAFGLVQYRTKQDELLKLLMIQEASDSNLTDQLRGLYYSITNLAFEFGVRLTLESSETGEDGRIGIVQPES